MQVVARRVERPGGGVDSGAFAAELNLRPEQVKAWTEFMAAWQRAEHDCQKMESIVRERLSDRAPELPEALHLETQKLTVRLDAARRLEGAARSLFACFSPRQKAKAGPLLARVCLDAVANTLPAAETNPPAFDPLLKVPQAVDIRAARAAPRARAAGRSGPVKLRLKRGDLRNG